jgi:hydrogenase-4 component B
VFLTGAAAIAALPPLNGLASEWLLYTGFFRAGVEIPGLYGLASLTAAAVLALIGGLALACFTRAFGFVFLGSPRSPAGAGAHEASISMRLPMGILAALCLGAGLFPGVFLGALAQAISTLAPGAANLAALSHGLGTLGFVSLGLLTLGLVLLGARSALLAGRTVAQSPTWDCGYSAPAPRMQYTASSFAEPLTTLFQGLLRPTVTLSPPRGYFPRSEEGRYAALSGDAAETALWWPAFETAGRLLGRLRFLQRGRVQIYLVYLFATLVALLVWALAS